MTSRPAAGILVTFDLDSISETSALPDSLRHHLKRPKKKKNKENPERNAAAEQGWSYNQQKVFMAQPLHHSN